MRVTHRLAVSVAAVAAGASMITASPAVANAPTTAAPSTAAISTSPSTGVAALSGEELQAAIRAAVAQKWRYEAAVRAAVAAKWRYDAAVRAAVAAKWRAAAAAAYTAPAASGLGQAALNNARSRLGAPYVWGGQGPWGFDCSGLIAWAYRSAGYNMPGGSYNQWNHGRFISQGQLAPGDLVFYGPGGSQHVAIYAGNGQVVQASNYNTGVHTAGLYYIGTPSGYKRI